MFIKDPDELSVKATQFECSLHLGGRYRTESTGWWSAVNYLAQMCGDKLHYRLHEDCLQRGWRGKYAIYIGVSGKVARNAQRVFRSCGLKYIEQPGEQPGEIGGWHGRIGSNTLLLINELASTDDSIIGVYKLV